MPLHGFGPGPAALYRHVHPPVRNVNEEHQQGLSTGQRIADRVASILGGWPFIICQTAMLICWMGINAYLALHPALLKSWDPYPFILLNLVLSFQAAYTGPVVMMSQNRQSEKDRLMAQHDYECNVKAEEEVRILMEHLAHQDQILARQNEFLADITARLETLQGRLRAQSAD